MDLRNIDISVTENLWTFQRIIVFLFTFAVTLWEERGKIGEYSGAYTLTKNEGRSLFTCCPPLSGNAVLHLCYGDRQTKPLKAITAWPSREREGRASSPEVKKRMGMEPVLCNRRIYWTGSCTSRPSKFFLYFFRATHALLFLFSSSFLNQTCFGMIWPWINPVYSSKRNDKTRMIRQDLQDPI